MCVTYPTFFSIPLLFSNFLTISQTLTTIGQHLLIDIKDVDSTFLNSEERLATAIIDLINESQLTLLSYHCHSGTSLGYGVSCIGVLLESHVSV